MSRARREHPPLLCISAPCALAGEARPPGCDELRRAPHVDAMRRPSSHVQHELLSVGLCANYSRSGFACACACAKTGTCPPWPSSSSRSPAAWLATFADPVRAQGDIDRFTSNAYDLVIEGESYRARLKPGTALTLDARDDSRSGRPFAARDLGTIALDLTPGAADPVQLGAETGPRLAAQYRSACYFKERPEPPCKPGSVSAGNPAAANIPLGRTLPCISSEPYPEAGAGRPSLALRRDRLPICSCTRWGLPCHLRHRRCGALLPHRFTLATRASRRRSAVCSLWHFPAGHPDRSLTGTLPCGARTFLGDPCPADRRVRPDGSGGIDVTREEGGGNASRRHLRGRPRAG